MENWESKMRGAYDTFNMDDEESRRLWERIRRSMDEADSADANAGATADTSSDSFAGANQTAPLPIAGKKRPRRFRKVLAAAAVAAVLGVLGTAAYATGFFGLSAHSADHVIETKEQLQMVWPTDENGGDIEPGKGETAPEPHEEMVATVTEKQIIYLAGHRGTPEYEAQREWADFTENAIEQWKDYDERNLSREEPWYELYDCWNDAMVDKLDEILEKYNLRHHETQQHFSDVNEFCQALGTEKPFTEGGFTETEGKWSGYVYDDGSFFAEGFVLLDDGATVLFSISRCCKGVFNEYPYINAVDLSRFEESEYSSGQGIRAEISSRAEEYTDATGRTVTPTTFIMVDRPESVVSFHAAVTPLTSGKDSALTQSQAEELIEMIDWDADSWK